MLERNSASVKVENERNCPSETSASLTKKKLVNSMTVPVSSEIPVTIPVSATFPKTALNTPGLLTDRNVALVRQPVARVCPLRTQQWVCTG